MAKDTAILDATGSPAQSQPMILTPEQLQSLMTNAVSAALTAVNGGGASNQNAAFTAAMEAITSANDAIKRSEYFKNGNPNPPDFSVFQYPEGGHVRPKPKFRDGWTYTFCQVPLKEDQLTPFEIELLNKIESPKQARKGTWKIGVERNGDNGGKISISVPASGQDERTSLPSFIQILTELLEGKDAADPTVMLMELSRLKKQLEDLQTAKVA